MTWYVFQMKHKPFNKITTFSLKEGNRDFYIAPYYSETKPKSRKQLIVYAIVFFIQELYA